MKEIIGLFFQKLILFPLSGSQCQLLYQCSDILWIFFHLLNGKQSLYYIYRQVLTNPNLGFEEHVYL